MKPFREWLSASLARSFVFYAVGWFVLQWALSLARPDRQTEIDSMTFRALGAVIFASLMTARLAYVRRRSGGARVASAVAATVEHGDLPSDADPALVLRELQRQRESLRLSRWMTPLMSGIAELIAIWLAMNDQLAVGVVCGIALVVVAIVNEVLVRRRLPVVESRIDQLER